jgi:hypothetical protein
MYYPDVSGGTEKNLNQDMNGMPKRTITALGANSNPRGPAHNPVTLY